MKSPSYKKLLLFFILSLASGFACAIKNDAKSSRSTENTTLRCCQPEKMMNVGDLMNMGGSTCMCASMSMMEVEDTVRDCIMISVQESMDRAEPISAALQRCYEALCAGKKELSVMDLYEALPELTRLSIASAIKAVRPEGAGAGTAVGFNNCNLEEVLSALRQLSCQLADCCENFTDCCDETFTVLEDIKNTLTECCAGTFTAIADLKDTITECCSTITADFAATWTILADLKDTLTECCNGTFTAIADLKDTLTECCAGTFTALVDIRNTLTECCAGTFTTLVDIRNTLTECCATITSLISDTCAATPIFGPTTITVPGSYCLANDIVGDIIIASDDVDLDLNNHRISGGTNGVSVNSARIKIFNGYIFNTIAEAILVNAGSTLVTLQDLVISDASADTAGAYAIDFQGTVGSRITSCLVQRVIITNSQLGIHALEADDIEINDCHISECFSPSPQLFIGIHLESTPLAVGNRVIGCSVSDCVAIDGLAAGILGSSQEGALINQCSVSSLTGLGSVGIDFVTSIAPVITNCAIAAMKAGSGVTSATGIIVLTSPGAVVEQCSISETGTGDNAATSATGLELNASPGSIINNVAVATIPQGDTSIAILVTSGNDGSIIRNCSCANITGSTTAAGYRIFSDNVIVQDCSIEAVSADSAFGYDAGSAALVTDVSFIGCHCANISSSLEARGFNLNTFNGYVGNCDAELISVPVSEGGTVSRGYDIPITTSRVLINNSVALQVTNVPAGEGFNVNGFLCQLQDCTAMFCANNGIRVFGTIPTTQCVVDRCRTTFNSGIGLFVGGGTTPVVTNCYSTANGGADYSGVFFTALVGTAYTDPSVVVGFNAFD